MKASKQPVRFFDKDFRKSSFSPAYPQMPYQCVLVASKGGVVGVRDSKDPKKTTLLYTKGEWKAFLKGVRKGEFDI